MNQPIEPMPNPEPSLHTVEMVCDRLAELGLVPRPVRQSLADAVAWFGEMGWLRSASPQECRTDLPRQTLGQLP